MVKNKPASVALAGKEGRLFGFNILLIIFFHSKTLDGEDYAPLTGEPKPVSDSPHPHSIMWVQRGRVFSRWKERVVVITQDYLQCFKKGSAQLSHVGRFLFQVECSSTYKKQYQLKLNRNISGSP
jgi:hypothetical protein